MTSIVEILEVADTIDLTILETAKSELGIPQDDTSQDAKLTRWIHEVSGEICAYVDRILGRETVRETFITGPLGQLAPLQLGQMASLPLRRYPVAFVDSVSMMDQTLPVGSYSFDMLKGLLYMKYGRWCGDVIVQYQAGYVLLGELPYDIERAALLLLRYRYSAGLRDPMIRSEEVPGVYNVSYWVGSIPGSDASLPSDVTKLLAPYKDYAV